MLNRSGITKTTCSATVQILANTELQSSVGCIVPKSLGVEVDGRTIVKAGTPINVNLENLAEVASKVTEGKPMNAVVLHDVDVTKSDANGTALVFGFINLNRVDATVASAIGEAKAVDGASQLLTFVKM